MRRLARYGVTVALGVSGLFASAGGSVASAAPGGSVASAAPGGSSASAAPGGSSVGAGSPGSVTPSEGVPPTVTTVPAAPVGNSYVTLLGSVNPENWSISACTFTFTPSAGNSITVPCASLPAQGSGPEAISATTGGLSQGTSYTYSLSVSYGGAGGGGETAGGGASTATSPSNGSFTTLLASMTAPTTLTATTATLTGTVNPEGQTVSACTFYYGTSASTLHSAPCSVPASALTGSSMTQVSATVSGLSPRTNYVDAIVLLSAGGASAVAPPARFTTLARPSASTQPATGVSASTATLRASVDAGGQSVSACAFEFSAIPIAAASPPGRGATVVEPCAARPRTVGTQTVTVTLRGLAPSTTYYDRVLLDTAAGAVIANVRSFHTGPSASRPGARITGVTLSVQSLSARVGFIHTGVAATRGAQCALVAVLKGRAALPRYGTCASPTIFTRLRPRTTYVLLVRTGNAVGWGPAATQRFTI